MVIIDETAELVRGLSALAGYAVVDLETTGFSPAFRDRVIEIAVVQLDPAGRVTGEWVSLVNPQRDLGPGWLHRIRAADAAAAPTFQQLAGVVARLLTGRVVVAHNLAFDARFLRAEFERLGLEVPLSAELGLCTMRLAEQYLPEVGRSLRACCEAVGVVMSQQHEALSDARAAAGLLGWYLQAAGSPPPWGALLRDAEGWPWPLPPVDGVAPVRRGLVSSRPMVRRAVPFHGRLAVGDEVVFTGQTRVPRALWRQRAAGAGLVVHPFVTRRTRLLVAADVDTMSVKARTARAYRVPIVSEEAFAAMLASLGVVVGGVAVAGAGGAPGEGPGAVRGSYAGR